jgi:cation diffusion facilitator family transporter
MQALGWAKRWEWISLAYLVSAVAGIYVTLGNSQAMKAAWLEDLLSLIPPLAFLVGGRVCRRRPNSEFPYGYHRATTIAYLVGALALLMMGLYLFTDSVLKLVRAEHPTIGSVKLFGHLAEQLHDKVLFADAMMNKADWLTAGAALLGVLGIGLGLWWADAVAAGLISVDIFHNGQKHLRAALGDLMDRAPRTLDYKHRVELPERIRHTVESLDWVESAQVRVREDGHVFYADVELVPRLATENLVQRLTHATRDLKRLDWRLHEVLLVPVERAPRPA